MISLSPDQFVFLYLLIFLAGIFTVWIASEMIRRNRERQSRRHSVRCRLCGHEFEDRSAEELPLCPRCGSRNERGEAAHF